ncbi:MAG: Kae1-associated kinase Bud32 [Nanoarchaeota archaeon]|nr:Kae1-associated kinase Bud32 [Nanoarchaeota archaeon]|tara:strand:+ start:2791 stop:3384 length:594 start_codon:yes stop_codon:yes gene_type:complete
MKILKQGAESLIKLENNKVIKDRIKKSYRIENLDSKIRKSRTKREAKLLSSTSINVPKVLNVDEKNMKIEMEYLKGDLLKDIFDKLKSNERLSICKQLGEEISKLHEQDIIHGDLTTSNLILKDNKLYFIDFGLGFFSRKVEDKAVDLHLLKQALESKHYKTFKSSYQQILKHYKHKEVITRLDKVESRGRYKERKS